VFVKNVAREPIGMESAMYVRNIGANLASGVTAVDLAAAK